MTSPTDVPTLLAEIKSRFRPNGIGAITGTLLCGALVDLIGVLENGLTNTGASVATLAQLSAETTRATTAEAGLTPLTNPGVLAGLALLLHVGFVDNYIPAGQAGTAAGDSAGIRAALASNAPEVLLGPRAYLLDAQSLTNINLAGRCLRGHYGQTILRQSVVPTTDMLSVVSQSGVEIRDIIFDGGGMLTTVSSASTASGGTTYPNYQPCVLFQVCSNWRVSGCQFIGFYSCGFLANAGTVGAIRDCTLNRGSALAAPANYGICIAGGAGQIEVTHNVLTFCQISCDMFDSKVEHNDISGWGFSAGINMQEDHANCHDNVIAFNHVHDSATVPDRDNYYLDCIENWSLRTTIVGNRCHGSIGSGIVSGSNNCVIAHNTCYNNGIAGGPGSYGIRMLVDSAGGSDSSGSIIMGNRCFDDRGAGQCQLYGYAEQTNNSIPNKLTGNNFDGNKTAATFIQSALTTVDGCLTMGITPTPGGGGPASFKSATGTARIGPLFTVIEFDITINTGETNTNAFAFNIGPAIVSLFRLPTVQTGASLSASPSNDLRLYASPGSGQISSDTGTKTVTYANLAGQRVAGSITLITS